MGLGFRTVTEKSLQFVYSFFTEIGVEIFQACSHQLPTRKRVGIVEVRYANE